jgi:hypothetical protein
VRAEGGGHAAICGGLGMYKMDLIILTRMFCSASQVVAAASHIIPLIFSSPRPTSI